MSTDIPSGLSEAETARVTVMVPLETKEKLNEIALEESTSARRVSMSDVARKGLLDFVKEYELGQESNEGAA